MHLPIVIDGQNQTEIQRSRSEQDYASPTAAAGDRDIVRCTGREIDFQFQPTR